MRNVVVFVLTFTLIASTSLAAAENGALPQGQPAGVVQAQKGINTFWVVSGAVALLGLGALLISTQKSTTSSIHFDVNDNNVIPVNNTVISTSTTGS